MTQTMPDEIKQKLSDFYTPDEINVWLTSPQVFLDGSKPIDLINSDQTNKVMELVNLLDDGSYI